MQPVRTSSRIARSQVESSSVCAGTKRRPFFARRPGPCYRKMRTFCFLRTHGAIQSWQRLRARRSGFLAALSGGRRSFWQQKFRDFERAAAVGEQLDAAGDAQDDELFSQLIDEETNSNLIIFIQVTVRVGGGRRTDGRLDR